MSLTKFLLVAGIVPTLIVENVKPAAASYTLLEVTATAGVIVPVA